MPKAFRGLTWAELAALLIAGEVESLTEGAEEAAEAIDKGLANALLNCWIEFTKAAA